MVNLSLSLQYTVRPSFSVIPSSVCQSHPPFHSQYYFTSRIFVAWFILQSRGVMLCFSLINVCLENTLIISTRANRIDNYTLYEEALSLSHPLCFSFIPSHCFFHSVLSPILSSFLSQAHGMWYLFLRAMWCFSTCN